MESSNYDDDSDFEGNINAINDPINPTTVNNKEIKSQGDSNNPLLDQRINQEQIDIYKNITMTKSINLNNFDPFNSSQRINSPRSLEICAANGVDPLNLYHKSYDAIKSICPPLKRNNKEYTMKKYVDNENKRHQLLSNLQKLREQYITCGDNPKRVSAVRTADTKYSRKFSNTENGNLSLIKRNITHGKELNPEIIKEEQKRSIAVTAKEIKNIVGKMKKEYNSYKTDYRVNSVSTVNKKTSYYGVNTSVENSRQSKDNNRYFSKVVERANKWDSNYDVFKKNKKLTRETESTNYYNRKKLLNEKEDYRRQILLERIKEHDNKTQSLEKQRTGLIKLRQEMRKNAAFAKYHQ